MCGRDCSLACLAPDLPIGPVLTGIAASAASKKALISVSDKSGLTELAKVVELSMLMPLLVTSNT